MIIPMKIYLLKIHNKLRSLESMGEIPAPESEKDTNATRRLAETFLKAAENVEMTDEDAEIAENHGSQFSHNSLMEYSNIQLDFIKVFGERVFVMVIGKI